MKKFKKFSSLMLIATMIGLLMTGCAQKTNDGANEKANDTKVALRKRLELIR